MTVSAREQSRRLVEAAILGVAGLAVMSLAALGQRGPRRDGLDPNARSFTPRRRRPRPDGLEPDGVPVWPNRPLDLSGGAAAALEFDD